MTASQAAEHANLRRSNDNERFVAFAVSAAEMLGETDCAGVASFAAGVFRSLAERIETEAEALRDIGVELGQGWLFGRHGHLVAAAAPRNAVPASLAVSSRA